MLNNVPFFRTWSHLIHMMLIFFAAVLATFWFEIGAEAGPSLLDLAAPAFVTSTLSLLAGTFVTQQTRALFNLMQTGRVFQYLSFWLTSLAGLAVSSWIFPQALEVHSFALASAAIVYLGFATAIFFGEVPVQGRSWLPVRMNGGK
ncbi:MAG: hypothetical protein K2X77_29435 [Candidatus Obscuribacterales bacterium]|jgi:hypothetical protein|nr:hypothetical protein [Candidatus Obscuribacterales bacterium]